MTYLVLPQAYTGSAASFAGSACVSEFRCKWQQFPIRIYLTNGRIDLLELCSLNCKVATSSISLVNNLKPTKIWDICSSLKEKHLMAFKVALC